MKNKHTVLVAILRIEILLMEGNANKQTLEALNNLVSAVLKDGKEKIKPTAIAEG